MELTPSVVRVWPRWRPGVLAWALWALVMLGIPVAVWLTHLLRQAGRSNQAGSNVDTSIYLLAVVSAVTVGAVLASRRPRHPVGWLLLALGLWFTYGYASWVLLAWRGAPPAVGSAAKDIAVVVMAACIGFILLLTPTGSLPSPRWRWQRPGRGGRVGRWVGVVGARAARHPRLGCLAAGRAWCDLCGHRACHPDRRRLAGGALWPRPGGGAPAVAVAGGGGGASGGGGGGSRGAGAGGQRGLARLARRCLPGGPAGGDRRGGPALPAV